MKIKIYDTLPEEAIKIRTAVFMEEQGFEDEFDEIDSYAFHVVIYMDEKAVATGRVFVGDKSGTYIIGRVATIQEYRKRHLGAAVIGALEEQAKKMGAERIELSAQYQAKGFYEKLGYKCKGEIYLDEHCEHIKMVKSFM